MLQLRAARSTWCSSFADVIHETRLKLHHAFLPSTSARAMDPTAADLLQRFGNINGNRNALEDYTNLMAVSNNDGSDFGFDIATNFHTEDQEARWVPELISLVQKHGGGQGSKPNSPKTSYLTLQINRMPCGCLYKYVGTNDKLLVWGAESSPPVIQEMIRHFIERMDLQDNYDVPGCLVINVYNEETHHIEWHSDADDRWGAIDMDTNIFTWNLGAHGFFQLAVKARSELAQSVVGGKGKASKLKTAGYRWGWVVEPRSISVMSKRCQKSCVHRVMNPDKARTVEAVCNRPDYIHHSKKTPRVIVSLRTMRQHDTGCADNIKMSRWLSGISPRNCDPCASTDSPATPSTQDQSDVNAISQTPVTVVDSALQSGPPVLHERPKWDSWTSEEEPMQVSEKKKAGGQPVSQTKTPSRPRWSSEDVQMQESEQKTAEDQPKPRTKTPSKVIGHLGNIERPDHTDVRNQFEDHLKERLKSVQFYTEILPLSHETVLRGYNHKARLFRVMMPLRQFRSLLTDVTLNHRDALRQSKWCFTMTSDVRDNLFWIDLAGEDIPTFKQFHWTQSDLQDGAFCSINKIEFSADYQKTCERITHCLAPLKKPPSGPTARSRSPRKKATGKGSGDATRAEIECQRISDVRVWRSLITDWKIREIMVTAMDVSQWRPTIPLDWPCQSHLDIHTWPMICWTVGGVLVRR